MIETILLYVLLYLVAFIGIVLAALKWDFPGFIASTALATTVFVAGMGLWGISPGAALAFFVLYLCLVKIPAKPPHVGLVTIRGERVPKIKKEGWRFTAPFFPFFYDVIEVKVEKVNQDIELTDVRTKRKGKGKIAKAGGELGINVSLTWYPHHQTPQDLINYLNAGGEDGVKNIIQDMVAEDLRQIGAESDWEAVTFGTDDIFVRLIKKLTGEKAQVTERVVTEQIDAKGRVIDRQIERETESTSDFRSRLSQNGFGDIHDLGISITRLNVGRIKEQGELAKAAEFRVTEEQERAKEVYEVDTEIQQARKLFRAYQQAGTPKTLEDCLWEIRRRKTMREGHGKTLEVDIRGLTAAAQAVAGVLGGGKGPTRPQRRRPPRARPRDRRGS